MMKRIFDNHRTLILVGIPVLIILSPLVFSVVSYALARGTHSSQPFLERPDAQYQECVRDTPYMRLHHMDLLKAIREEMVREGRRGEIGLEVGVKNCKKCHASRERFCNQCHNAANVHLDCFGCHDYPESPRVASREAHVVTTE